MADLTNERVAHPHRDLRQREIVPPAALASCHALVIGVGAIGRQAAIQLAAIGVPAIDLVDDDVVGVENLAPQAYWPGDLGRAKVEATAELCRQINPAVAVTPHPQRFRRSSVRELDCFWGGLLQALEEKRGDCPRCSTAIRHSWGYEQRL